MTPKALYCAIILSQLQTASVVSAFEKNVATGRDSKPNVSNNKLYCFVILETAEFKDRMANFVNTGYEDFSSLIAKLGIRLCVKDLKEVKKEIVETRMVAKELIELVKNIDIPEV